MLAAPWRRRSTPVAPAVLLSFLTRRPGNNAIRSEPWTDWQSWEGQGYHLVDEQGNAVPYQITDTHEALTKPSRWHYTPHF